MRSQLRPAERGTSMARFTSWGSANSMAAATGGATFSVEPPPTPTSKAQATQRGVPGSKLVGGEGEIRTPGDLRHGCFQDSCIKPLCHLSTGDSRAHRPVKTSRTSAWTRPAAVRHCGDARLVRTGLPVHRLRPGCRSLWGARCGLVSRAATKTAGANGRAR